MIFSHQDKPGLHFEWPSDHIFCRHNLMLVDLEEFMLTNSLTPSHNFEVLRLFDSKKAS